MRTRTILVMTVLALVYALPAMAQGFLDIPASNSWTKVQDGATTQWSIITPARPETRIDFVSYVEDGVRTNFYMIRSLCSAGKVSKTVIKQGNKLGPGTDCGGNIVTGTSSLIDEMPALPAEASALLQK